MRYQIVYIELLRMPPAAYRDASECVEIQMDTKVKVQVYHAVAQPTNEADCGYRLFRNLCYCAFC